MQNVQSITTQERDQARSESAKEFNQSQPFAAVLNAVQSVVDTLAGMRANARKYHVEYVNG